MIGDDVLTETAVTAPPAWRSGLERITRIDRVYGALISLLVLVLVGPPVLGALVGSFLSGSLFTPGTHFTLATWPSVLLSSEFLSGLELSLLIAVATCVGSVVIGFMLAFVYARTDAYWRGFIRSLIYMQLTIPAIVTALAWVALASPRAGLLNYIPIQITGSPIFNVYSYTGLIAVMIISVVPRVTAMLIPSMQHIDADHEEAALLAGAGISRMLRTIVWPGLRPAVFGSATVAFALGLESFVIPAIIGSGFDSHVLAYEIYESLAEYPSEWQNAAAIGTFLIVVVGLLNAIQRRLLGDVRKYAAIGSGRPAGRISLRRWRIPVSVVAIVYVVATVLLPLAAVIIGSVSKYSAGLRIGLHTLTLSNFALLGTGGAGGPATAIRNTILISVSGGVALVLISLAACVFVYGGRPGRMQRAVDSAIRLSVAVPAIVAGSGLLFVYFLVPLPIYGTIIIVWIAVVTLRLPQVYVTVVGSYTQINRDLRESAVMFGASVRRIITSFDMPLLAIPLISSGLFAIVLAAEEVNASVIVYTSSSITVPVLLWQTVNGSSDITDADVVALVLVAFSLLFLVISWATARLPALRRLERWRAKGQEHEPELIGGSLQPGNHLRERLTAWGVP